ncbi:MAG: hypothetical protein IJT58_00500 [Synergistaceae bacterium]|nr:hypothetical protein [Synergistaceae bacterium]
MKKYFALCLIFILFTSAADNAYAWWWSDDTPYVTPENTNERIAEEIIRDVWGSTSRRTGEENPITRVIAIKGIPQADGSQALDMRIHIEGATEHGVLMGILTHINKLFPKLIAEEKLNAYNEFRLYGSLPMKDQRGNVKEDWVSKVFFTRKAAQQVSWDKIDTFDLHSVLSSMNDGKDCTYWVHGGILSRITWLQ